MTAGRKRKREIRERMSRTGENYTKAAHEIDLAEEIGREVQDGREGNTGVSEDPRTPGSQD